MRERRVWYQCQRKPALLSVLIRLPSLIEIGGGQSNENTRQCNTSEPTKLPVLSMSTRVCVYSPTFFAYPHHCTLFITLVLQSTAAQLLVVHFVSVAVLNTMYPDIFYFGLCASAAHHATV